jgi:hypothetical protein
MLYNYLLTIYLSKNTFEASYHGNIELAELLILKEAKVDQENKDGVTPLIFGKR